MVLLGKPKERSHEFVPVEIDGITTYQNRVFSDKVKFQVNLSKLLFMKNLRLDLLS